MEQKSGSLFLRSSLIAGLFIGIVLILLSVIFYASGLFFEKWTSFILYLILILGSIWAQLRYRKALGGEMSYGQAFGIGIMAIVFGAILFGIYFYLLYKVIDPSLMDRVKLLAEQKLVESGSLPEDQMEMVLSMQSKFTTPGFVAVVKMFGDIFWGVIISLVTAIFTKKQSSN